MAHYWKAEVTVTGVSAVTEDDVRAMYAVAPMLIRYDSDSSCLFMSWRFEAETRSVSSAVTRAWNRVLDVVAAAPGISSSDLELRCSDFRVLWVDGL